MKARAWGGAVTMLLLFPIVFIVALGVGFALQGSHKLHKRMRALLTEASK